MEQSGSSEKTIVPLPKSSQSGEYSRSYSHTGLPESNAKSGGLFEAISMGEAFDTVVHDGALLRLELHAEDPRPFLGALADLGGPAPAAIESGRLSLTDLYRTVYGVDGL